MRRRETEWRAPQGRKNWWFPKCLIWITSDACPVIPEPFKNHTLVNVHVKLIQPETRGRYDHVLPLANHKREALKIDSIAQSLQQRGPQQTLDM